MTQLSKACIFLFIICWGVSGESFTGPALEKTSKARSSPWSQGMQLKAQTMLLIKIGSNYINPLPLELLIDRCAAVTAEWPLTEMFSFLAFVTLSTCLWQDQGKGFFRVPILTASPQLYIPQNSWTSNTYCLFAQITMCPYQSLLSIISAVGLWSSCQSLALPSQIPVVYWFHYQSHSLFCSGDDGMFSP